ncbi:uncharacterized protein EDB91DRAFT_1251942 [Suillus paluster]|uniref:uncharacterized protein n=1 Tax=Suillus paluster TaxID=48578 RepID=UPI001B85D551|nr:uncharacterized protein EDB91DRAFT_1251942 [Suillus paluster]KAG1732005.1 hypothetical protein EDB91DRAFT_1251942 [Suillus paluster]
MKSPDTPKEKVCADMFLVLPQHLQTFIGLGIDNSPVKPSVPIKPIDDSVTELKSEVEQGAPDVVDKLKQRPEITLELIKDDR